MPGLILSINAGSSSVKVSVYSASSSTADPEQLAEAQIDGLTAPPPTLKYERGEQKVKGQKIEEKISNQKDAFRWILQHLENDEGLPQLRKKDDIGFTCHRVVHGGDYSGPKVVSDDVYTHVEELSDLAPLHNASSLSIIQAVAHSLPHATNIAYFDSAFHQTIPRYISTYPIDPKIATHNKLRKYGFHGISYAFILGAVSTYLSKPASHTNIIALHLGSGASACAIRAGASLDTSMGLTPLAGLPGATRSGSIDPSLVFHYTHDVGRLSPHSTKEMHITTAEEILNKQSGWKALTGTTDFGVISYKALWEGYPEHEVCRLALDIFVDRILGFVGSYFVKLDGEVDALVFAGGIGEKGAILRKRVVDGVKCLGFELDDQKNDNTGEGVVSEIGYEGDRRTGKKILVVKTDEQLEMAKGVAREFMK